MASVPSPYGAADSHADRHREAPDSAQVGALAALRAHGERVTEPRRAVIEALARTHEHLSADRIVTLVEAARPAVHRATVYRTLDVLVELGIVSHVHAPGGASVYHLVAFPAGQAHLHAHCRLCGAVSDIPVDALDAAAARIEDETGFRMEAQQSTLAGVCAACAEKR
jgi:Fur family ferric uptake transcriptional regulator